MERYIVKDNPGSPIAEAYRKIVANIEFANIDNDIKTIMVTSSIAGEGKTTTVCNLACVMTDLKKNILIIDMDLRKPTVHKHFKISNKIGLTDLLMNKDDYKSYINKVYPRLDVLTTGKIPANPIEVIASKALKDMLKELSENYDYIFLDTPPLLMVSDPITIATFSDAVILTVSYGETEKEAAKKSIDSLNQINANIVGTVLNKMPVTKHHKYYYYSYE
jgi:capsular exopolysaccharide synthesis family protein